MSFDAGAITSTLGLDISPFTKGMLQANSIAAVFPTIVTSFLANPLLGVIQIAEKAANAIGRAMGAIKDAIMGVASSAHTMGETAEKVGVSVEFLSGVGYAAQNTGVSVESLSDALKFLNNNAADAASGSETAMKAFSDIGVTVTDASGKLRSGEAIFYDVADALAALPTAAQKTQAAMNLMGRGGTDMIPAMKQGSASIKAMQADAQQLGAVMTTSLAEAGNKWGKLETTASMAWDGIKQAVATPVLQFIADHFEEIKAVIIDVATTIEKSLGEVNWDDILQEGLDLFKQLGETIKSIDWGAVVQGVLKIGSALLTIGEIILKLIEAASKFIGLLASIPKAFGFGGGPSTSDVVLPSSAEDVMGAVQKSVGGRTGGGGTTIQNLNIKVDGIDVDEASGAIADKIHAPLREAVKKQQTQLESKTAKEFAVKSL